MGKGEIIVKRLKNILTLIFIIGLIFVLLQKNGYRINSYKDTEFLFDTTCTITAYGKNSKSAVKEAFEEIEKIHKLTNFYSEASDVARINSAEKDIKIKIDKQTAEIIECAIMFSEMSGGAFDITVAPVSLLWNFKSGKNKVPEKDAIENALKNVDFRMLTLDRENLEITKKNSDLKIDLGGIAKGYACDKAKKVLEKYGCSGIINLGGNIGCVGENPETKGGIWRVGLQTPFETDGNFEKVLEISSGCVVTSGTYQRYFEKDGKIYHHIINPADGYPKKSGYSGVTITHNSAMTADCLSTACFVLGEEDGKKLAEKFGAEIYYY